MSEDKLRELQMTEQNLQSFLIQKQNFQAQLMEAENALEELKKSRDKVYKIIGSTIIETNRQALEKETEEKVKMLNIRLKSLEKQESQLKDKSKKLQDEVLKSVKK